MPRRADTADDAFILGVDFKFHVGDDGAGCADDSVVAVQSTERNAGVKRNVI